MGVFAILPNELIDLAKSVCDQKAETLTVKCKAAHTDCPKRLYDTLSSFSNQDSGGIILFGVDENAGLQVVGVYDAQELQKRVTEQCNQMNRRCGQYLRLQSWTDTGSVRLRFRLLTWQSGPAIIGVPGASKALLSGWVTPTFS